MKITFSDKYLDRKEEIIHLIENFRTKGVNLTEGQRNSIKIFELGGKMINIKSFKVPNAVNKIAYKFFRSSKAERSYDYAHKLIDRNISTPHPVAFAEDISLISFGQSFYASEHLPYDLTYRELVQQPDFPNNESILRAFTRFTFKMHENRVEFLDHSPGNTLIRIRDEEYDFFLVDLNRMNFRDLDFDARMKNFSRLTPKKDMVRTMANEYAPLINRPESEVFEKMWFYTEEFQKKFFRKKRLKNKLKFWKKA